MLVENQFFEIKLNNSNKKWFKDLGYEYTNKCDTILVPTHHLTPRSNVRVKVKCDYCNEIYETQYGCYKISNDNYAKDACKKCAGKKNAEIKRIKKAKEKFAELRKVCDKKGYILLSSEDEYNGIHTKIKYICPIHGENEQSICNLLRGHYCYKCGRDSVSNKMKFTQEHVKNIIESKPGRKWLNYGEYTGASYNNLKIKCVCGEIFYTSLNNYDKISGVCKKCQGKNIALRQKLTIEEVKTKENKMHKNKILNPEEYINNHTYNLKVKCQECGKIFLTKLDSFENGLSICNDCVVKRISSAKLKPINEVIDIIESKNNNKLLNPCEYKGNSCKLSIQCGSCGKTFKQSLAGYNKNIDGKCPDCSERSYGEFLTAMYLDKYGVAYSRQEHFDGDCHDTNPLPFDFYLPEYNICIEYDGEQHFEPVFGEKQFLFTILHDGMKNNYCKWNNIRLIRIPYWERDNIERILIKELNLTQQENIA